MLEERKQEILNPGEPHGANLDCTSHEANPRREDTVSRSETDKDKAQDTATSSQRLNGTEYHAAHQTHYERKIQSGHLTQTENVAKSELKTENTSVARQQDTREAQTAELTQPQIQKSETERSQKLEGGGQNNGPPHFSPAHGGQNNGPHFSPAASSGSRNNVNTPSSPSATSGLRHVRNEEERAYNRSFKSCFNLEMVRTLPQQVSSARGADGVQGGHGTTEGRLDGTLWKLCLEQHPAGWSSN